MPPMADIESRTVRTPCRLQTLKISSGFVAAPVDVSFCTRNRAFSAGSLTFSMAAFTSSKVGPRPAALWIGMAFAPCEFTISTIISEKKPLTQTNASVPGVTRFVTAISTASWPGTGMMMTSFFVLKTCWSIEMVSV